MKSPHKALTAEVVVCFCRLHHKKYPKAGETDDFPDPSPGKEGTSQGEKGGTKQTFPRHSAGGLKGGSHSHNRGGSFSFNSGGSKVFQDALKEHFKQVGETDTSPGTAFPRFKFFAG